MTLLDHFSLWSDNLIVVIDVETTGFSPDQGDRIVEVAAVLLVRLKVAHRWRAVINPERPIPEDASRLHGFYDEDVALAAPFRERQQEFLALCSQAIPCAYGESFDRRFISAELTPSPESRALTDWPVWLDPLSWVRSIDRFVKDETGGKVSNSLSAACARYGVAMEAAHGALADAVATAELLRVISGEMPRVTVSELLRRQQDLSGAYERRRGRSR